MDQVNTRVNDSRKLDLRKWVSQDGFGNDFRMQCADGADDTTASAVTSSESNESSRVSTPAVPVTQNEQNMTPQDEHTEPPTPTPMASTPVPDKVTEPAKNAPKDAPAAEAKEGGKTVNEDVLTSLLDSIRQVNSVVSDVKMETEALASKLLQRELEHGEIKVC